MKPEKIEERFSESGSEEEVDSDKSGERPVKMKRVRSVYSICEMDLDRPLNYSDSEKGDDVLMENEQ